MPRILEKLSIREVSAVDRGAGQGVKVLLMKRSSDPLEVDQLYDLAKADETAPEAVEYLKRSFTADQRRAATASGAAMPGGGFPIEDAGDLSNAVQSIGRGKAPQAAIRRHIASRAKSLGLTDKLPADWTVKKGFVRTLLEAIGVAKAKDFEQAQEDAETGEFAQSMMDEFREAIGALAQSIASIMSDDGVADKKAAIETTLGQFQDHIGDVVPESVEKAMRGAALAAAGYEINPQGNIVQKESATMAMTEVEKKAYDEAIAKAATADAATGEVATMKREIAMLKMSDSHKSYCSARGDDMSTAEKGKFADMTDDQRDAHMKSNPVKKSFELAVQEEVAKRFAADPTVVEMRKSLETLQKKEQVAEVRKSWTTAGLTEVQMDVVQKAWEGLSDKALIEPMVKQLAAANAQAREGGIFKELGGSGNDNAGATPHDEIMAKAHELKKTHPELTIEQAYAKAFADPANASIAKRDRGEARRAMGM